MSEEFRWYHLLLLSLVILLGSYMRYQSATETEVIKPLSPDARDYFMYAYNLKFKGVYSSDVSTLLYPDAPVQPDAVRNPGYPIFLLPFVNSTPNRGIINRVVLVQACISVLTLVAAFFLFKSYIPVWWAIGATSLTAISPHLIVMNSYILSETLFCLLLVVFSWMMSIFWRRSSSLLLLAAGVVLGLSALVHPSSQYFIFVLLGFLVCQYGLRRGMRFFAILALGSVFALSPWIVRNMVTLGTAADNTLMIVSIGHGMYPYLTYESEPESYGFPYKYDPRWQEIVKSLGSVISEVQRRFVEEPVRHLFWFLIGKPLFLWSWDNDEQGMGDAFMYEVSSSPYFTSDLFRYTHVLMHVLHWSFVCLGLFSAFIAWFPLLPSGVAVQSILTVRLISLLLMYFVAIHMVGAPIARYSVPLRPLLYGLSLFLPYMLMGLLRDRCSKK